MCCFSRLVWTTLQGTWKQVDKGVRSFKTENMVHLVRTVRVTYGIDEVNITRQRSVFFASHMHCPVSLRLWCPWAFELRSRVFVRLTFTCTVVVQTAAIILFCPVSCKRTE